jgi:glycerol-3-phosphate O-acyltransferase
MIQAENLLKPYNDADVEMVLKRLSEDFEFLTMLSKWRFKWLYRISAAGCRYFASLYLKYRFRSIRSIAEFQDIMATFAAELVGHSTQDFKVEGLDQLESGKGYLFLSNHRDIACDSMLLNFALYLKGLPTVRIAVGDNLNQIPFVTDIMRLNKSFFISRNSESLRQQYSDLVAASTYIRESIQAGQSVWLAQSEGRAKDGIDQTDISVLKMLQLSDRKGSLQESLISLNIVPMSLSYEFDPCDELKARELTKIEEFGSYSKQPGEDLMSLVRGLSGAKGRVVLRLGQPLLDDYQTLEQVVEEVDRQVLCNATIRPINIWAYQQIFGQISSGHAAKAEIIDDDQRSLFEAKQAVCPQAWRQAWLRIYANPVVSSQKYQ